MKKKRKIRILVRTYGITGFYYLLAFNHRYNWLDDNKGLILLGIYSFPATLDISDDNDIPCANLEIALAWIAKHGGKEIEL